MQSGLLKRGRVKRGKGSDCRRAQKTLRKTRRYEVPDPFFKRLYCLMIAVLVARRECLARLIRRQPCASGGFRTMFAFV